MGESPAAAADLEAWLGATAAWAEAALDRHLPAADVEPASLHGAMRYAVLGGGKRFRPAVVRMVCEALGGDAAEAELPAVAIELVHGYSLVHDDLPCMDDDDLRRGRPTVHVVHGEAMATLVGDALQTLAFELLADAPRPADMVRALARAAGSRGMVGGQVLDIESSDSAPTPDSVQRLQSLKTAAMVRASAELGALAADATPDLVAAAGRFGEALGQCFQVVDDLLDVTATAAELGKTPGKDAALHRGTAVEVLGLEGAGARADELAGAARRAADELGASPGGLAHALVAFTRRRHR